ncbi:MAG: DeoR/GlpR family DNA-binding transcription regulator, partial [Lacticaseibacillus paracasei]
LLTPTAQYQPEAPARGLDLAQLTTLITDKKLSQTHKQWFAPQTQFLLGD